MTRWITGLPRNLSRKHRNFLPATTRSEEHRQCQECGSRNEHVNRDLSLPESTNHCQPTCAKAREFRGRTVDLRGEEAK